MCNTACHSILFKFLFIVISHSISLLDLERTRFFCVLTFCLCWNCLMFSDGIVKPSLFSVCTIISSMIKDHALSSYLGSFVSGETCSHFYTQNQEPLLCPLSYFIWVQIFMRLMTLPDLQVNSATGEPDSWLLVIAPQPNPLDYVLCDYKSQALSRFQNSFANCNYFFGMGGGNGGWPMSCICSAVCVHFRNKKKSRNYIWGWFTIFYISLLDNCIISSIGSVVWDFIGNSLC